MEQISNTRENKNKIIIKLKKDDIKIIYLLFLIVKHRNNPIHIFCCTTLSCTQNKHRIRVILTFYWRMIENCVSCI